MTYEQGKRYLVTRNGVQFATTYEDGNFISDIDGQKFSWAELRPITPLTGIRAMKVGDVVVEDSDTAKVLAIDNSHSAFSRSRWDNHKCVGYWVTLEQAEEYGWTLQSQPDQVEITIEEIAKLKGIKPEQVRIKKDE